MLALIVKYWPIALSALISLFIGYNAGHYFGVKNGVKIEAGNNAKTALIEADQASKDKVKNETKYQNRTHADNINNGRKRGWLRSDEDR